MFRRDYIAPLDGFTFVAGGWLNRNYIQVAYQLAIACAEALWSFCVSFVILMVMNYIPGLKLRATEEQEVAGMDDTELGEFAVSHFFLKYLHEANANQYDYVEVGREAEKAKEPSVKGFPIGSHEEKPTDSMKPFMPTPMTARPSSPGIPAMPPGVGM